MMSGTLPKIDKAERTRPQRSQGVPQKSNSRGRESARDSKESTKEQGLPFLKDHSYANVILVVEGKKIFINSCVLGYASPYFHELFNGSNSAGDRRSKPEFKIEDKSFSDFVELLSYLHPAVCKELNDKMALRLLPLAHEYGMRMLKERCEKALAVSLKRNTEALQEVQKGKRRNSQEKTPDILLKSLIAADSGNSKPLIQQCVKIYGDPTVSIKELKECENVSDSVKTEIYEKRIDTTSTKLSKVSSELEREKRENDVLKQKISERGGTRNRPDRFKAERDSKPNNQATTYFAKEDSKKADHDHDIQQGRGPRGGRGRLQYR